MLEVCVDVVIPFYNRPQLLERLFDSLLNQTVRPRKIFLIDNGSSFESVQFAYSLITSDKYEDLVVVLISTLQRGNANYARNLGLDISNSRYIAFLDSDDWWEPLHLEMSLTKLQSSIATGIYSGVKVHGAGFDLNLSSDVNCYHTPFDFLFSKDRNIAQTSSYVIDSERLNNVRWDESLRRHQDYDFFLAVDYFSEGWVYNNSTNVNFDRVDSIVGRKFDFESMIAFLDKWRQCFSIPSLRYYLKEQLEICYIVDAEIYYKNYYRNQFMGVSNGNVKDIITTSPFWLKNKNLLRGFYYAACRLMSTVKANW